MNISQLSEQLKDVPQATLIGYAKNPNSVVPQFLALAEIQRRQQLQAPTPAPASTVANDVLTQATAPQVDPALMRAQMMQRAQQQAQQPQAQQMAQQLPENQPGVAQLPTGMGEGFASGGIVAFAGGGISTESDDEDDDREMARLFPESSISLDDIMAIPKGIGAGIKNLASKLPQSYEATKAAQEAASPRGSHKYESAVLEEAKRQGVDPNLALHVLYKETGNLKNPENARSKAGAIGVMQLMPKTAAGLGVNPMDPMENIRGGVSYLKQMADKYKDNRIAAAAYNAGPGNVDKALKRSGGLDTLSGETRNYIAGLAQGGEVKKYAGDGPDGSDVQDDSLKDNPYLNRSRNLVEGIKSLGSNVADAFTNPRNYDPITKLLLDPAKSIQEWGQTPLDQQAAEFRSASMTPDKTPTVGYSVPAGSNTAVPSGPATPSPYGSSEDARLHARYPSPVTRSSTPSQQDWRDFDSASALFQAENANKTPTPGADQILSQPDTDLMDLRQNIKDQAAALAKQGDINGALALMQAGFGMMASKSPYLLQGIGAGGEAGVSTYAALNKQQQEGMKDLLAARLGLYKYGEASKNAARDYALKERVYGSKEGQSAAELAERIRGHDIEERKGKEANAARIEGMLRGSLKNRYDLTEDQKELYIQNHPLMRQAYTDLGINMNAVGPVKIQSKDEYDKLQTGQQYIDPNGQLRTKG
jgi:soluble lytic murein transglycosylase-like protein